MAILPILTYPDPRLKVKSKPVVSVDAEIRQLMEDMYETMVTNDGCGLAAPQVGVHKRVIVVDISYKYPDILPLFLANPEIVSQGDETLSYEEGCLSIPGKRAKLTRARNIRVRYLDKDNVERDEEISDLMAYAIQHEIDHLNGVLFIDRLSPIRRQMLIEKTKR